VVPELPVIVMDLDKSDPATYMDEKKAEAYVSQSYTSRVADLVSILKCTTPSNIVAPNDGAGSCYRAATILGRPVVSSDPSLAMCLLSARLGNKVKHELSRVTVDNFRGSKDTLFVVSHSEALDPGLALYIFERGYRLLVFESKIGYRGYSKLHPCHPFIRTSYSWSLPIMLSRNYKSVDKMAWVNISQTSSVAVSEVSCIPYVYAPFYLLREPMLVNPLTDQVRESLDPSMVKIGSSKESEISVWMKKVKGKRGYWVVRGMYHDIPREQSIIFVKNHGAFVPTVTGKSEINGFKYEFLTMSKWLEVNIDGVVVQTQVQDISISDKTFSSPQVRPILQGTNSSTYWFDVWKTPNLCNVSSTRIFTPDVRVNLRVEKFHLPLKINGILSSDGKMDFDVATQMFRSNSNTNYSEFVFLLGVTEESNYVTEVLNTNLPYNRIRFRELKGWLAEYGKFTRIGRMQCDMTTTVKLRDLATGKAYDSGVTSLERAITTIKRRDCSVDGVPWVDCPVPQFINEYWDDFCQLDSTKRVGRML
jgi:hypothetical protein